MTGAASAVRDVTPGRRRELRSLIAAGRADGMGGEQHGSRLRTAPNAGDLRSYDLGWHLGRRDRLGIPLPPEINAVDPEDYARSLFCEEAGEALAVLGRGGRFGHDTPANAEAPGATARSELMKEAADVLAAIEYGTRAGLYDRRELELARDAKLAKLLSPDSRDNLGRRLAPPPGD